MATLGALIIKLLLQVGAQLLTMLLTEKVIGKLAILLLGRLVKSTKNKVDDKILNIIREALGEPVEKIPEQEPEQPKPEHPEDKSEPKE